MCHGLNGVFRSDFLLKRPNVPNHHHKHFLFPLAARRENYTGPDTRRNLTGLGRGEEGSLYPPACL